MNRRMCGLEEAGSIVGAQFQVLGIFAAVPDSEPKIEQAVKALRDALIAQGWPPGNLLLVMGPKTAGSSVYRPKPEIAFMSPEDSEDDEYDAHSDPLLMNQLF